jgi:hypothetical protein
VTGVCFVAGTAQVTAGLTIAPNAVLLATDSPSCAQIAHLDVSGGISVQSNGILSWEIPTIDPTRALVVRPATMW